MRIKTSLPATCLTLSLLLAPVAARQQQQQSPNANQTAAQRGQTAPQDDSDDVVRITSNLVQLDVTVTDNDGRLVTDLAAEEFEILEEGKAQKITSFSYVPLGPPRDAGGREATTAARDKTPRNSPPVPPVGSAPLRRGQVRRTVALVVDDLRMSQMSVAAVRDGLRKFVDEQMQPGDLVAVYRTRGGSSALQQFTTDKAQLHKAIDTVRWYPAVLGGTSTDAFEPVRVDGTFKALGTGAQSFEDDASRRTREGNEDKLEDISTHGSLGMLRYLIRGMSAAPGRKTVLLFSDGLPVLSREGRSSRAGDLLDQVIDSANRAAVTINTVDARGVVITGTTTAQDEGPAGDARVAQFRRSQEGFYSLADGTGGRFIKSVNKLDEAVERVLRDHSGYYLLGYQPSGETFKGGTASFRDIKVRVTRPGVNVRYRKGFLAVADEDLRRGSGTDSQLYSMLASPVTAGEVYVRLTPNVIESTRSGTVARLLLHIDGGDVTFTDEAGGWKKLVLDVAAVTLGKEGEIVDEFTRTHTIRTGGDVLERIQRNGLTYTADVPLKKPGSYQLRIVVRDQASKRLGSAGQFIEVPDLTKKRLAISGITMRDAERQQADAARVNAASPATAETALAPVLDPADPAVRRFRPGQVVAYGYQVYNATLDPAARRPRLTAQVRLFHNAEVTLDSGAAPLELDPQPDPSRAAVEGAFRLVENAKAGEYVLQVVVTDALGKRQATQWIDFEVVR